MDNPPSNQNYAFRFGLRPVRKLTQAIEALCDPHFNPTARGRIDAKSTVAVEYFSITARSRINVSGLLVLRGSELDDFQCTTPITGNKFVNLNQISTNLVGHDEDSVTIFQAEGSNHITFMFGEDPTQQFTAELFENNDQTPGGKIEVVPSFSDLCRIALPSRDMHLLASQLLWNGMFQPVTVSINKHEASIVIGDGPIMTYTEDNMYPNFTGGIMHPWRRHKATFYWTYPVVLLTAARLSRYYSVFFETEPPMHAIFRFNLPHGRLYFLKEATRVTTIDQQANRHLIN